MADTTISDLSKPKLVEMLKAKGLAHSGNKSDLIARLQAAIRDEDHGDILDSDEIDSDAVLDDEDEKSHSEVTFDESVNESINEELALADPPLKSPESSPESKPQRILKRKNINTDTSEIKPENKGAKKIVLNRPASITTPTTESSALPETTELTKTNKIKITLDEDSGDKTKLELRAQRFGIPIQKTDSERKEARKQRFGQGTVSSVTVSSGITSTVSTDQLEKLKKRAERFGESVSKVMIDLENREKLEKRKQKFGGEK